MFLFQLSHHDGDDLMILDFWHQLREASFRPESSARKRCASACLRISALSAHVLPLPPTPRIGLQAAMLAPVAGIGVYRFAQKNAVVHPERGERRCSPKLLRAAAAQHSTQHSTQNPLAFTSVLVTSWAYTHNPDLRVPCLDFTGDHTSPHSRGICFQESARTSPNHSGPARDPTRRDGL